jgi:hypothetical protein
MNEVMALMNSPPHDQGASPIREVSQPAKLPDRRPDNMWAGRSAGLPCAICGAAVSLDEMEYELEYARNRPESGMDTYHVHVPCFTAHIWEVKGSTRAGRRFPAAERPT